MNIDKLNTQLNRDSMALLQNSSKLLQLCYKLSATVLLATVVLGTTFIWGDLDYRVYLVCQILLVTASAYSWITFWQFLKNVSWWMGFQSYHVHVCEPCDWSAIDSMLSDMKGFWKQHEDYGVSFSRKNEAMQFKLSHGGQ